MKLLIFTLVQFWGLSAGTVLNDGCQHECHVETTCRSKQFSSKCYYIFSDGKRTWHDSKELCQTQSLSMVQFAGKVNQSAMNLLELLEDLGPNPYIWLGGRANDLEEWTFINDVLLNETGSNMPSAFSDGQKMHLCGVISAEGVVDKDDCSNINNFVCRYDDWQGIPSIYVSEVPTTWFDAMSRCHELGSTLFYLNKQEDFGMLRSKIAPFLNQNFFIGLTHRLWQWEDGTNIKHYNWEEKEPNQFSEKCIVMYPSVGMWNDMNCNEKLYAFCQKDTEILDQSDEDEGQNSTMIAVLVTIVIILVIAIIALVIFCIIKNEQQLEKGERRKSFKDNRRGISAGDYSNANIYEDVGTRSIITRCFDRQKKAKHQEVPQDDETESGNAQKPPETAKSEEIEQDTATLMNSSETMPLTNASTSHYADISDDNMDSQDSDDVTQQQRSHATTTDAENKDRNLKNDINNQSEGAYSRVKRTLPGPPTNDDISEGSKGKTEEKIKMQGWDRNKIVEQHSSPDPDENTSPVPEGTVEARKKALEAKLSEGRKLKEDSQQSEQSTSVSDETPVKKGNTMRKSQIFEGGSVF